MSSRLGQKSTGQWGRVRWTSGWTAGTGAGNHTSIVGSMLASIQTTGAWRGHRSWSVITSGSAQPLRPRSQVQNEERNRTYETARERGRVGSLHRWWLGARTSGPSGITSKEDLSTSHTRSALRSDRSGEEEDGGEDGKEGLGVHGDGAGVRRCPRTVIGARRMEDGDEKRQQRDINRLLVRSPTSVSISDLYSRLYTQCRLRPRARRQHQFRTGM